MATDLKLSGYKAVQQATCVELELIEDGTPVTVRMTDHDVPLGLRYYRTELPALTAPVKFFSYPFAMSSNGYTVYMSSPTAWNPVTGMSEITAIWDATKLTAGKANGVVSVGTPGTTTWTTYPVTGWNQAESISSIAISGSAFIGGSAGTIGYANVAALGSWTVNNTLSSTLFGNNQINTILPRWSTSNTLYVGGNSGKIAYGTNVNTATPTWSNLATTLTSADHVTHSASTTFGTKYLFGTSTGKLRWIDSATLTTLRSVTGIPAGFGTSAITSIIGISNDAFLVGNAEGRLLRASPSTTINSVSLIPQHFGSKIVSIIQQAGFFFVVTEKELWVSNDVANATTGWTFRPIPSGSTFGSYVSSTNRIYFGSDKIYSATYGYPTPVNENELYSALGSLLSVSQVTSEVKPSSSDVTITLSGINNDYIADIISNPIKGGKVTITKAFIDPSTNQILSIPGNPATIFRGIINNFSIEEGWQDQENQTPTSTISLTCNSSVGILSNKITGRRTNHTDQTYWFSGDMSMDRVGVISDTVFDFGGVTPVNNNNVSVPKTITG